LHERNRKLPLRNNANRCQGWACIDADIGAGKPTETLMQTIVAMNVVSNPEVKDGGRVQIGAISPSFPPLRAGDHRKDETKVRMGAISPAFPPARAA